MSYLQVFTALNILFLPVLARSADKPYQGHWPLVVDPSLLLARADNFIVMPIFLAACLMLHPLLPMLPLTRIADGMVLSKLDTTQKVSSEFR